MTVTKRKKINSGKIISLLNLNPFTFSSEINPCSIFDMYPYLTFCSILGEVDTTIQ